MASVEELRGRFRAQASTAGARAPFLARVCVAIAERPDLAALLTAAPETQQAPTLLLAAIHAEVLGDPGSELAGWFPTTAAHPRDGDVGPPLERFVAERTLALRHSVATRSTQTNEVGRCGVLLPALGRIADECGPLALVDVGTSAGLNLRLDRYQYAYEPGGAVGPPSPVQLTVGTRGDVPVPARLPEIAARIGIDRQPVDVTDAADATWLRACVWPDQRDRLARLDQALAIAAEVPADVRRGDAVADVADAVDAAASAGHPVVVNTWVLSYLDPTERAAYVGELARIGATTDLSWVFAESPALTPGLPHPTALAGDDLTALGLVRWRAGRAEAWHLGIAHPHGYWLHWAATPTDPPRPA